MNRIDSRARGNAPQLLDKYKKLAQDAQHNGDRVQAEYYLQFADHYYRVIADGRARQDEMRARRPERDEYRDRNTEDEGDRFETEDRRTDADRGDADRFSDYSADTELDDETADEGEGQGQAFAGGQAQPQARRERQPQRERASGERTGGERTGGERTGGERTGGERGRGEPRRRRETRVRPNGGEIDAAVLPPAFAPNGEFRDDLARSAVPDDVPAEPVKDGLADAPSPPRRRRKPVETATDETLTAVG